VLRGFKTRRARWPLIALWVLALGQGAHVQQAASQSDGVSAPQIEAAAVYSTPQGQRMLTVWRRELGTPPATLRLRYLKEHPERSAVPNLIWYAIDAPAATPTEGSIVWLHYDYAARSARPTPLWRAAAAVDPAALQAYVAVLKSTGFDSELALSEVPKNAVIAVSPENLTFESLDQWPAAAKPVANVRKDMASVPRPCTLSAIDLTALGKGRLVATLRGTSNCSPVYMEYSSDAPQWREMALVPAAVAAVLP